MIEVGEYVRTKDGTIGKVINIDEDIDWIDTTSDRDIHHCSEVVNHSKKLIDLIEVGDIISYKIDNISTTLETKGYIEGIVDIADNEMLQKIKENKNYYIKSIITKELIEQMEYKV